MRRWLVLFLYFSVPAMFFLVANLKADDGKDQKVIVQTPLMREVNPDAAKPGDAVVVTGEYLDKAHVAEVFLTAGDVTLKVEVLSQEAGKIRFVTPKAEPGRLRLMVLTKGGEPVFIEQPVMLEIK